jgi:hypothetical protein
MGKLIEQTVPKEVIQMDNKYRKKCSTLAVM